jgi:hypothetical protein
MEFGKREEESSGKVVHGEWHLWLYLCDWRIESGGQIIAGSDDDRSAIEGALKDLLFGAIESVGLLDPTLDLSLQFSSGTKVLTFSSSSSRDEDQWMLFTPDGHCLTVHGGGSYEYPLSSQPRPNGEQPSRSRQRRKTYLR